MATKKKAPQKKTPDPINPDTGLSARQEEFARQYLVPSATQGNKLQDNDIPFNGTRAAIRAGYAESGAHVTATRLLKNAKVQAYMATLQKPAMEQFNITQERILQEMASLAFSNVLDFIHIDEGSGQAWIDITKCSRDQAAALSAFEVIELPPMKMVENGEEVTREVLKYKIKLHDKKPIIEMLAKREQMLEPDRLDVNVTQKLDEGDRMELAKRIAFMLRKAAEQKKKDTKTAKMGKAKAQIQKGDSNAKDD
jgi:phage terminase small subunit